MKEEKEEGEEGAVEDKEKGQKRGRRYIFVLVTNSTNYLQRKPVLKKCIFLEA